MAAWTTCKRVITLISLILSVSLVGLSVAFAQPSTNHATSQKAKASQDALVIKTPSSQEADVGEQQELTVKVGLGDNRLKPVDNITYHLSNSLKKNIGEDLKAMNNLSSGRSCRTKDDERGVNLNRKKAGNETCKFVFKIKSPNSSPTTATGDIKISANGSQVKKQTVSVNIIKPALSISKTLFTEPNSSSDHKGFVITNNSNANIFINSATKSETQSKNAHGVTLSDQAFVQGLGDTDKCNIVSKDKAEPDKALKPGDSCRINLNVAKDARQSTNFTLEGNFGTKTARVNIPEAHVAFSGKDNSTPIPAIFVKDDGTKKEVDIQNMSPFQIHINDVVAVNKRVDIPDKDNNCQDKDLSNEGFCTLKIKDDGDLSRTDIDYLKVKSPNLSAANNEQYLFVGTTGTVNLVPLSRHFLQTGESFIMPSKQSYPNAIVYRVYNNQSSDDITIENRDDFLSNLNGSDLAKSDFDLTACYKSDGTRITAGNKLSSDTSCDRMLIFTQTTPLNDQIARARFDAQEGDSTQTNQLTDQYVFSDLYVGGQFISAGERPNTTNIAAWGISKEADDSESHANRKRAWKPLGAMDQGDVVHALTTTRSGNIVASDLNSNDVDKVLKGNALYVGGSFDDIEENAKLGNIAFWQGDDLWSPVEASSIESGGTTGTVYSLDAEPSGDLPNDEDASLYVAGNFDEVAVNDVSNVARWTVDQADRRSTWRKLEVSSLANQQPSDAQTPAGANGTVLSAFWKGSDTVMLAGEFDKAGGSGALSDQKVAEWDRSKESWSNVGSSTSVFQPLTVNQNDLKVQINSFKELDGETVAGGRFKVDTSSLDSSDQFLALLDSGSWIKFPDEKLLKNDKLKTSGVDTMARADGNDVFGGSFKFDSGATVKNKNLMVGEIKSSGCSGSNPCFNLNKSFAASEAPNGAVLAVQGVGSSNNVFLGGDFTNIQGGTQEHIVKFTNFDSGTVGSQLKDNGHAISDQGSVKAFAIMNKLEPEFPSG